MILLTKRNNRSGGISFDKFSFHFFLQSQECKQYFWEFHLKHMQSAFDSVQRKIITMFRRYFHNQIRYFEKLLKTLSIGILTLHLNHCKCRRF